MTTLTASAPSGAGSAPRWPLLWVTWRRHRLGLIAFALVAAAFAARLIITGLPVHAAYAGYVAHRCVTGGHAICATYQKNSGIESSGKT